MLTVRAPRSPGATISQHNTIRCLTLRLERGPASAKSSEATTHYGKQILKDAIGLSVRPSALIGFVVDGP